MAEGFSLTEKEFSLLCEVITSLQKIQNMDTILATIFRKIRSIIHTQGASIALHDPAQSLDEWL